MHYNVKTDKKQVWFSSRTKFNTLTQLIEFCKENKAAGVAAKLTNICLIPNPHADPTSEFYNKVHDSLHVPISELELGNIIVNPKSATMFKLFPVLMGEWTTSIEPPFQMF